MNTFSELNVMSLSPILINGGSYKELYFDVVDSSGCPVDITAYTYKWFLCPYGSPEVVTLAKEGVATSGSPNQFGVFLYSEDTAGLVGKYIYQPVVITAPNHEFRLGQGIITVVPAANLTSANEYNIAAGIGDQLVNLISGSIAVLETQVENLSASTVALSASATALSASYVSLSASATALSASYVSLSASATALSASYVSLSASAVEISASIVDLQSEVTQLAVANLAAQPYITTTSASTTLPNSKFLNSGAGISTGIVGSQFVVQHGDTSSQSSITNVSPNVIQSISLDDYGHITSASSVSVMPLDGWIPDSRTWTYASANSFTVSGDVRTFFPVGTKIKMTQSSTTKYFNVISTSYSSPNTTVNVVGGNDYYVTNVAISGKSVSYASSVAGFPSFFTLSTPTWTTTGTAFTNQPTTSSFRMQISGRTVYIWGIVQTHATSGGTGMFIATFPSGQLPYPQTDSVGSCWNTMSYVSGGAFWKQTEYTTIKMAKYDGTAIAGNSTWFAVSVTGSI